MLYIETADLLRPMHQGGHLGNMAAHRRLGTMPGIYSITSQENGRVYIGSSLKIASRLQQHFYSLDRGTHTNLDLREDYLIHGAESFTCAVLKISEAEKVRLRFEADLIQTLHLRDDVSLYNLNRNNQYFAGRITMQSKHRIWIETQARSKRLRASNVLQMIIEDAMARDAQ